MRIHRSVEGIGMCDLFPQFTTSAEYASELIRERAAPTAEQLLAQIALQITNDTNYYMRILMG